jgi:predicted transcriptional regulator
MAIQQQNRVEARAKMARALAMNGFEDVHTLDHETADEVLTPKRRELLERLSSEEHGSVRALARAVDRDKGAVSKDLRTLAKHDLIAYEERGASKAPRLRHQTLVVEPVVFGLES